MSFPFSLPGYSYDPVRKKYFSTPTPSSAPSSSHASTSQTANSGGRPGGPPPIKRSRLDGSHPSVKGKEREVVSDGPWQAFARMQSGHGSGASRRANRRDLAQASLLASKSCETSYLPLTAPGSFVTTLASSKGVVIAGDSSGLIYSLEAKTDDSTDSRGWMVQMSLGAPITSIDIAGDHFIATSFGPCPKLIYSPLDFSAPRVIIQPKKATDVWSSLLLPSGAVALGCDSHLLYTSSPVRFPSLSTHPTPSGSAVLSMCALGDEPAAFLAGTRGGTVSLFDTRTFWRHPRDGAFGSAGGGGTAAIKTSSPVVSLESVGGKSVVVAGMNGDLDIYDFRFLQPPSSRAASTALPKAFASSQPHHQRQRPSHQQPAMPKPVTPPALSLPGHVNSYSTGLALLYHARSNTVLASGQDRVVRVWDCQTGRLLDETWGRKTGTRWSGTVKGLVDLEGMGGGVGSVDGERWDVWR